MPSPFPGMDPFIEGQPWQDFHARFINDLADLLMPQVRPRYVVEIEQYVYLARDEEDPDRLIKPDLSLVEQGSDSSLLREGPSSLATLAPVIHTVPVPRQHEQRFLSIRDRQSRKVVTVIELLSPTNKAPGDGRSEYLVKRSNVFYTLANLVEIDLLRGGQRLPTLEPLAPADYYVFVSRAGQKSTAEVYGWTLRERLPVIPVPLAGDDSDVPLDLQAAFRKTYDRAGYDYSLNYRSTIEPALEASVSEWAQSVVGK